MTTSKEEAAVTVDVARSATACSMRITGAMWIRSAGILRSQLLEPLQCRQRLEVDLAGVQEFDSAGMQLLYLLKREVEGLGGELVLSSKSDAVKQVLDLYHMTDDLETKACDVGFEGA